MKTIPVVLCGGAGARLWPLSRRDYPKQFVPLFDDEPATLFGRAMARVGLLNDLNAEGAMIVCNHAHRFFVADGLSDAERQSCTILVEPHQRNTAPAATVAALAVRERFGDGLLLIMPSDHVIADQDAFVDAVTKAAPAAEAGQIVVFGIPPTRAESGYGYIHTVAGDDKILTVKKFREKPDAATAAEWLARGNCYWNSGIFYTRASVYLDAIKKYQPDMLAACQRAYAQRHDDLGFTFLHADTFAECRADSIDYAVMERAATDSAVSMVAADMGWSDLGNWNELANVLSADSHNNRMRGDVLAHDATDNIVYSGHRLIGMLGAQNCLVVDTEDALLVADKNRAGDIKQLVTALQKNNRAEADTHRKVFRPWGYFETLNRGDGFQVKRITIHPGQGLSLQLHRHRSEHWVVVAGEARVTRGEETFSLSANQSTYIPAMTKHRLENTGEQIVRLIEIQCGDYLGEDDIVRFDDRYGRGKPE